MGKLRFHVKIKRKITKNTLLIRIYETYLHDICNINRAYSFNVYFLDHRSMKTYMKFLLNFFLVGLGILSTPQYSWTQIMLSQEINWNAPKQNLNNNRSNILSFDGQNQIDESSLLPLLSFSVEIPSIYSVENISTEIVNSKWEFVSATEINTLQNALLDSTITKRVVISKKQPYLELSLLPFKKGNTPNSFYKLKSILIKVSFNDITKTAKLKTASNNYVTKSVLAQGKWVRIKVTQTGVHKIPYSTLVSWGFSNPANVKVYGNGGNMLPKNNADFRYDDLKLNATMQSNDNLYFYGQSPTEWVYNNSKQMFTHISHDYTDVSYYYLSEEGLKTTITDAPIVTQAPNITVKEFDDYKFIEENKYNVLHSGRTWYGDKFDPISVSQRTYSFSFPEIVTSSPAQISAEVIARSSSVSQFELYYADELTPLYSLIASPIAWSDVEGAFAREASSIKLFLPTSSDLNFTLIYKSDQSTAIAYLDKLDIQARRQLKKSTSQFQFRDLLSVNANNIAKFEISTDDNSIIVWDITDFTTPQKMTLSGTTTKWFVTNTPILKEFVAFSPSGNLLLPEFDKEIPNQNLHGLAQTDYIIITAPEFLTEANRLASLHQENSGMRTTVVSQNLIFNEFSSGKPDVTAIRAFVKMFYDRAGSQISDAPKYLLLFGDGSYDNRSITGNTNKIMTYQSKNSIVFNSSYVTDDFFGFLDDIEGVNEISDRLDIGIGRFPVNTKSEAQIAVDKTDLYLNSQEKNNWITQLTFIGDDGDNNTHMNDADRLAQKVELYHPEFNINKIYFDSYKKTSTSKYPDVETAIENAVNGGSLIMNYTGHGGELGLSHEQVITIPKILSWTNRTKLSLFVTATCEFSRFDNKNFTSAGEWVFLSPKGGGIALLTTTRIAYSSSNYDLNNSFFTYVFERNADGTKPSLGDILVKTKIKLGSSSAKLNFTLLGDPAIKLAYPDNFIKTLKINNTDVDTETITLNALSKASLDAEILRGEDSTVMANFMGNATVTVFDKPITVTTLGNENAKPFTYKSYSNILYKGKSSVTQGVFSSDFIMPKDIRYNEDYGKIVYYAESDTEKAIGSFKNVIIGGFSTNNQTDTKGPDIQLWLNDKKFKDGGVVGLKPLLLLNIFDENGINTSGNGIGHDLTCEIDGIPSNKIVLNSYFINDIDNYKQGSLEYQLPLFSEGNHIIKIKAWDNYNNSSEKSISFNTSNKGKLGVSEVVFSSNPISLKQSLYVTFKHDEPNQSLVVTSKLYTLTGQFIGSNKQPLVTSGYTTSPLTLNISEIAPAIVTNGIYFIQFELTSETGKTGTISDKIIVTE